jgi:DNA-binding transcriptional MerR regulator
MSRRKRRMRISELAERTGVPVHTLKFYLREGVLMPGRATSRTRAEYGEEHVSRVGLVRALVEHGRVSLSGVRAVVAALDAPPPRRHDLLGVAHCALPGPATDGPVSAEVADVVADLGWRVAPTAPALASLSAAVAAARTAGVTLPAEQLRRYAQAVRGVAEVDVDAALATDDPAEALRTVVIGTVAVDPVILALRRVAQEAVSAERG